MDGIYEAIEEDLKNTIIMYNQWGMEITEMCLKEKYQIIFCAIIVWLNIVKVLN